jgi:hypothetical protein
MPSAEIYAGVTQGLANVQQYERDRPIRDLRLQEAQARQQKSMMELEDYQGTREPKQDLEVQRLSNELYTERTSRLKTETFGAFDTYEADGDTRHLNTFLQGAKKNPNGAGIWGKWNRFDPLVRNRETEAMLGQAGITDIDAFFSKPELVKSKTLGTDMNGEQTLLDMNKLYAATGYTQHTTNRTLESLTARAKLEDLLRGQQSAETQMIGKIAEEQGIGIMDAAEKFYAARNSGKTTGSTIERTAEQLMQQNPNLGYEDALRQAARTIAPPSATEKDINVTAGIRDQLDQLGGGNFYDADLEDPVTRRKAGALITNLEKATGKKMSNEAIVTARNLRSLTALGETAGSKLSNDETGILDKLMKKVRTYISDNTEGVEATAAYESFRNVFRNALYGASLTSSEIGAFNAAAGTLGQQLGPVLEQLKVQMSDVKEQMQSLSDFEDPAVAYYYLGQSKEDIAEAIVAIDERIDLVDKARNVKKQSIRHQPTEKAPVVAVPDGTKPTKPIADRWKELSNEG